MGRIANKPPAKDIQPDLPGADGPRPKVPASIKRLLPQYLEQEVLSGTARLAANKLKEKIFQLMMKEDIPVVLLQNGGKLVWKEGKDTLKYEPPKETDLPGGGEEANGGEEEPEGGGEE